ncbi:MAG: SHOCT domain-containing protein [Haloarculaceae archaeon]
MTPDSTDTRLATLALVALGALVALPFVFMTVGTMGFGPMMGGTWGHGMWGDGAAPGWMPVVGAVMQLLVLAALLGVGYLFYRAIAGSDEDSDRALEELRLAYAQGELSDEEYENRRQRLEGEG